ncbi:hypothetical protein KKD03_01910, partial [Patescibacteria group bacterium]|nr:hypothetical protein [Patescibacteria group bacterium]
YSKQLISHEMFTNLLEESFKICKLENIEPNKLASAIVNKNIIISHEMTPTGAIKAFKKLSQTDDVSDDEIIVAIKAVMAQNDDAVVKFKSGDTRVIGFFIGQTIRKLGKKIDNKKLGELLFNELKK